MVARAAVAVVALMVSGSGPALAQTHVREPLSNFLEDPSKLATLLLGVAVMKSRDDAPKDSAEYRTSWEYWSAIHGYPGTATGTIEQWQQFIVDNNPVNGPVLSGFFAGLENLTPPDALSEEVWSTCEHNTPQFFTWHRIYLYFFERVLRDASEDPNFALPYWDYTGAASAGNEPWRVPAPFTVPQLEVGDDRLPNPLFEPRRTPGFGTFVQLDPAATDIDTVLSVGEFETFQTSIDGGVHAYVHCATGNGCLAPRMGIVPFAAGDPIFWHHHANVDRIFSCWLEQHGTSGLPQPGSDWMNTTYAFVDETGARVEMSVAELFDPNGRIDYAYDAVDAAACFRVPPEPAIAEGGPMIAPTPTSGTEAAGASDAPSGRVLARDVRLSMTATSISASADGGAAVASATHGAEPRASGRTILRLNRVEADEQPGAVIAVELAHGPTGDRLRVGTIAFFALSDHASGHAHAEATRNYAFDVTKALGELGVTSLDNVTVEFRAEGLVAVVAPAAMGEAGAMRDVDPDDVAASLRNLDSDRARDLLAGFEAARAAEARAPEADDTLTGATSERFRRANVSIGEIILDFGI